MILGDTPADLLSPQTLPVVTDAQYAAVREQLRPYAEHANELVYLRSDPPDGDVTRDTYRLMLDGDTQYVSFVWREGLLIGLRREDE
jgi:hypothetical protein